MGIGRGGPLLETILTVAGPEMIKKTPRLEIRQHLVTTLHRSTNVPRVVAEM